MRTSLTEPAKRLSVGYSSGGKWTTANGKCTTIMESQAKEGKQKLPLEVLDGGVQTS